ncbi:LuxR family transcriptional regulator [Streptomyces sp. 8K308]|uniref:LuxR family transcriptional regulator n=1 Tax=Streptomyces sp. 8K308 TaxID=2530388 RepID=UPI001050A6DC|nr:LuxR family transcriptional regulator [Streptomyces sp. 8K308]TDC13573.1 LuxR family transcriptional regulator [Streptomyces sp. 8K308]
MIHGREAERARLAGMLAAAAGGRAQAVVVRGEAGIGKSALLDHVVALHGAGPLLRTVGTEAERDLPFAALHALLRPVRHRIDALPRPQSAALRTAFGQAAARGGDRFLVGVAVLTLLADLSENGPLLCVVDDAQWLDHASADALLFAVRRLNAEPVTVVFGARAGEHPFAAAGVAELALTGLDAERSTALLAELRGEIAPAVRDRVVAEAEGNPLALIELSGMLGPEERAGRLPALTLYTEATTPAGRVETAYRERVAALPDRTRSLLALAAAEGTGALGLILRAAARLGTEAADLEPAEHAGLVRVESAVLTFRHPLVKAAAYRGAPLAVRQAAHRALSDALGGADVEDLDDAEDRRAHHLAAAATGVDEALGRVVERAADRALRRGAPAVAAAVFERSAQLSEDRELRARRLAAAAEAAAAAGQLDRAGRLVVRGDRLTARPELAARLAAVAAALEFERGNAAAAGRIAVEAAETMAATTPEQAVALLGAAAEYAWFAGDGEVLARASHLMEIARRHSDVPLGNVPSVVRGTELLRSGDHAAGLELLRRALAPVGPARPADVLAATHTVFAALRTGGDSEALAAADELTRRCRAQGRVADLTHALQLRIQARILLGHLPEAEADAAEGLRIADAIGHSRRARNIEGVLSLAAATRGDAELCEELARSGTEGGLAPGASWGGYALGLLALGLGDHRLAADRLAALWAGPVGHTVIVRFALPSLVEAAVRLGDPDRAAEPFARFEGWAHNSGRPWALAVTERCRALLAGPEDGERHYLAALDQHEHATRPFEHARTLLLYGEWLRRARRRNDAATRLRAAAKVFHRLGATPWFDRAVAELAAIGAKPRDMTAEQAVDELAVLTAQERQVALLAATGASNREIAAQLFLSPRTVGYHLYNAFPKLGITSRAELSRFDRDGAGSAGRHGPGSRTTAYTTPDGRGP